MNNFLSLIQPLKQDNINFTEAYVRKRWTPIYFEISQTYLGGLYCLYF